MTSSDSKVVLKNLIVQNNFNQKKKKEKLFTLMARGEFRALLICVNYTGSEGSNTLIHSM